MNTLVVDDEVLVRWSIERILRKWGHSVANAESVAAARPVLDTMTFDKVIVDLRMPGENGMVLVEELLGSGYLPGQLIICSAYVSDEMEEELNGRGVTILRKPFMVNELLQVINGMPVGAPVHSMLFG